MYDDESPPLERTALRLSGTLTLVSIDEGFSIYRDRDGHLTYLQHGTAEVLLAWSELDIRSLWAEYRKVTGNTYPDDFEDYLRERTYEPDEADDDLVWCTDCSPTTPWRVGDLCPTGDGGAVCPGCLVDYWHCDRCEQYYPETTTTLYDTEVCRGCRDDTYSYCTPCDGWHRDEDEDEHQHEGGCRCESPAQHFAVRNDGAGPLFNDVRASVSLPAGEISDEGVRAIRNLLKRHAQCVYNDWVNARGVNFDPYGKEARVLGEERVQWYELANTSIDTLEVKWQTKEGNFTKRLSRLAYKGHGLKVPPEVISEVGNIGSAHSQGASFDLEVTRDLNQSAEAFGNEDSCWWQSYYHGRCALKSNGGFGIRAFDEDDDVSGRVWVLPLRKTDRGFGPTFRTMGADAFIVFNAYGVLSGYIGARILSHMAGMTYRKVQFTCDPMYVNSNAGYLVAPEEIAEQYTDGVVDLAVAQHATFYETEDHESKELVNA